MVPNHTISDHSKNETAYSQYHNFGIFQTYTRFSHSVRSTVHTISSSRKILASIVSQVVSEKNWSSFAIISVATLIWWACSQLSCWRFVSVVTVASEASETGTVPITTTWSALFDGSAFLGIWRERRIDLRRTVISWSSAVAGFIWVFDWSRTQTFPHVPPPPPQASIAVITSSSFSLVAGFITTPEAFFMNMFFRSWKAFIL